MQIPGDLTWHGPHRRRLASREANRGGQAGGGNGCSTDREASPWRKRAPGPVLSPQIDGGARLALKGPTVAFLNLLPLLSEFPWPHPLPSDLHLNKHIKKKSAIDNKGLSALFCFVF